MHCHPVRSHLRPQGNGTFNLQYTAISNVTPSLQVAHVPGRSRRKLGRDNLKEHRSTFPSLPLIQLPQWPPPPVEKYVIFGPEMLENMLAR